MHIFKMTYIYIYICAYMCIYVHICRYISYYINLYKHMEIQSISHADDRSPPVAPTPAAQLTARRKNRRAPRLERWSTSGGSLVDVAAARGSAHKAKKAKTVIQTL